MDVVAGFCVFYLSSTCLDVPYQDNYEPGVLFSAHRCSLFNYRLSVYFYYAHTTENHTPRVFRLPIALFNRFEDEPLFAREDLEDGGIVDLFIAAFMDALQFLRGELFVVLEDSDVLFETL